MRVREWRRERREARWNEHKTQTLFSDCRKGKTSKDCKKRNTMTHPLAVECTKSSFPQTDLARHLVGTTLPEFLVEKKERGADLLTFTGFPPKKGEHTFVLHINWL